MFSSILLLLVLSPAVCLGQLVSCRKIVLNNAEDGCRFQTYSEPAYRQISKNDDSPLVAGAFAPEGAGDFSSQTSFRENNSPPATSSREGFHWRRALAESFTFLVIEQAYVVHTDFNWVVSENGIPFNHYGRDYAQSLTSWWHAGWSAGEDPLYNYVGHPIQGALTSYIEIQNDPKNRSLEFSNTKTYWKSRLKATLWNAVYSTQWSMGPLSEMTVEKYGTKDRPAWNANGSFPCDTKTCYSGVGKVNLVMTPVGGLGWVLAEDILDKKIAENLVEQHTRNRMLIDTVRCALNPIRGGANILHGNRPWYRSRDSGETNAFTRQEPDLAPTDSPRGIPNHGDVSLGFSHLGTVHCENPFSGVLTACDPLSGKASILNGWSVSVEAKYLRYFGIVADFSGQYGSASQNNFLFGLRGGAWIGRFLPYAQVMVGAVHTRANEATITPETSFAESLGIGNDFRVVRRISWRNQVDVLKTGLLSGTFGFERYNIRLTSGLAVRF